MKRTLFIFFFFHTLYCAAQVQVRTFVDRDEILIGEPIQLSLEAYMPLGENFSWFTIDTLPHFEIISKSKIDTAESFNGKKIQQVLTITGFDSGRWSFPALTMIIGNAKYVTDTLSVQVNYASFNKDEAYHDIKDIMEVEAEHNTMIPWIIGIASFLALSAAWFLLKKKKPTIKEKPVIYISPYDEAMRSLENIRKKGFEANGEVKEFYSSLNNVLRIYLHRKLGLNSMEKTNEEIITTLAGRDLGREEYGKLTEALRIADYVKFAKFHPDASMNEQSFTVIRNAIESLNKKQDSAV